MSKEAQSTQNDSEWVKLVSNDGYSFLIRKKVAMGSGTLKNMLSEESNFSEAVTNTCAINERGVVLEKLCEYLSYKALYGNATQRDIPDFTERITPEIALELLVAADYYET